tara:strand:- start:265 stop:552 length:288 start_codon:yes stop_codon:yes gene_type:complete
VSKDSGTSWAAMTSAGAKKWTSVSCNSDCTIAAATISRESDANSGGVAVSTDFFLTITKVSASTYNFNGMSFSSISLDTSGISMVAAGKFKSLKV